MSAPQLVRLIRVFVSSPGDVAEERKVLDEIVNSINRTEGRANGIRLETFRWEEDVTPQIGPDPQQVVDAQTPAYDIYLGIMSTRFGTATGPFGSGTEQEFRAALQNWQAAGRPWITFYFDAQPTLTGDPEQAEQFVKVCKFKAELQKLGIIATYSGVRGTANGFYEKVSEHLRNAIHRLGPAGDQPAPTAADPVHYLRDLSIKTSHIDIRGLQVGTGRANHFPIDQLFISLTTSGVSTRADVAAKADRGKHRDAGLDSELALAQQRAVPLHNALRHDRLVVVGDPGAGKTTFLRRIAHALCQTQLGEVAGAAKDRLGVDNRLFPIFVRLGDLAQHLLRDAHQTAPPAGNDVAAWLPHYLRASSDASSWGLDESFFREQLEGGKCTVLLDGLDEAPDRFVRERLARVIANVTAAYGGCRFVVTSRPAAYTGEVVLPEFAHARIDPLSDDAVETFLTRWCEAIYAESVKTSQELRNELLGAIQARPEIRRMARNPVMLTALAVVHWNERRLPEQRADLYNSIITWLSRSREQRPERVTADRTVVLLQELALAMQDDPEGRKTQVPKRWAAEKLAGEFSEGKPTRQTIALAERFLDEEEVDSGIIVGRGNEVAFWHLTFQEFLAAKATVSRLESEQTQILFAAPEKIYLPDWREVVLLLAGALHQQGRVKVDWLIRKILDQLGESPDLAAQARCSGLIGNILRDLEPLKYKVSDARYHQVLEAAMAIFDRKRFRDVAVAERIAAADALGQAGDPRIDFARDDYWVTIPDGKFLMGAQTKDPQKPNYDKKAGESESPVHEVYLGSFRMARFPITVGQFEQFVNDKVYDDERLWEGVGFGQFTEPEDWERQVEFPARPVVGVSWWEAMAYCRWSRHRLPTEAEWERAARGTEARKYPWGKQAPDENRTNFNANVGHPTPVGIFPLDVTADGILDVGGNVWEWCADSPRKYSAENVRNPQGSKEGRRRVYRGGGWDGDGRYCRSAYRYALDPDVRGDFLGFRVCLARSCV